jgi:hypothetical protein
MLRRTIAFCMPTRPDFTDEFVAEAVNYGMDVSARRGRRVMP